MAELLLLMFTKHRRQELEVLVGWMLCHVVIWIGPFVDSVSYQHLNMFLQV